MRPLVGRVRRRLAPLHGIVPYSDYRRVRRMKRFREGTLTVAGRPLRFTDAVGVLHSIREIFVDEVYRFAPQSEAPFVIDVGANVGLSVLYCKLLAPGAEILAFEADPHAYRLLAANLAGLAGVHAVNAAAWVADGCVTFYSEGSLAGSTEIDFSGRGKAIEVPAVDLRAAIGERTVDFLKLDIEGGENLVIPHIADRLPQVRNLFFEYHSSAQGEQRLGQLLEIVSAAGFRYALSSAHGVAHPFVEQAQGFDVQVNVSCFRDWQAGRDGRCAS